MTDPVNNPFPDPLPPAVPEKKTGVTDLEFDIQSILNKKTVEPNPLVNPFPDPLIGKNPIVIPKEKEIDLIHHIGGRPHTMSITENDRYKSLLKEMDELKRDRNEVDIPLSDSYWSKKTEIDNFISRLRS